MSCALESPEEFWEFLILCPFPPLPPPPRQVSFTGLSCGLGFEVIKKKKYIQVILMWSQDEETTALNFTPSSNKPGMS